MKQHGSNTRNGGERFRDRLGTKAIAAVAAFSLVASMCPGAAALAYVNGQMAAGSPDGGRAAEAAGLEAKGGDGGNLISAQADTETVVTKDTHEMKTGTYHVTKDVTIGPDGTGNGIRIAKNAKVFLDIDEGATLTVTGRHGHLGRVGCAAILLPEHSTLIVSGKGTLNATGGNAGIACGGRSAGPSYVNIKKLIARTNEGGKGGEGGYGAGAGIGTNGGLGGEGGPGGAGLRADGEELKTNVYGNEGTAGEAGQTAKPAGTLIVTGSVAVNAKGGAAGAGGGGGNRGRYNEKREAFVGTACGTSGGGGGGGGGSAADGIGSGGTGGGGGGGGASANIDGEPAFFCACDLDDLWGHGGSGGASAWGGASGDKGDEGASNDGDDTAKSKKYAKAGGAGGACPAPKTVPFYIYADGSSAGPKVTCTSGHGKTRSGTVLSSKNALSAGMAALTAQAESGSLAKTADGAEGAYDWEIAYSDESGAALESEPTEPGRYTVTVSMRGPGGDSVEWSEPYIVKRKVAKPTPAELVFECADWETGEGAEQDAFPKLDGGDYEFVVGARASGGLGDLKSNSSLKSAKEAGSYAACFRLKDPAACQWEGESEDVSEIWVPWSIKLQEFDPNDVSYWGTARGSRTTTVAYTGEPQWVRPWFTYAKGADGRFPAWFTHWGSSDRPGNDKGSAVVVYLKGEGDEQGLVGYHTCADGTLEPVTGAQVYAWVNGVDVAGQHVAVQSGDRVWYKTGEDGWWVPLAVQEAEPSGAEGSIVARDYAYIDKLGVKDAGTYQAYALFDEGSGFAPTALAEAAVTVTKAKNPMTAKGKAFSAPAGKKTVYPRSAAFKVAKAKGAVTFKKVSGNKKIAVNKKTGAVKVKKGLKEGKTYKAKVKVTAAGNSNYKKATKTVKVKVKAAAKGTNPMAAKGRAVAASAKKAKVFKKAKAFSVSRARGAVAFEKVSGSKRIAVTEAGKVTVKKGLKAGKAYKVKVRVTAAGNRYYKRAAKTVTLTVRVK